MMAEALVMMIPTFFASIANYSVLYYDWFPALKRPISAPLFGANKTWRGVISLSLLGVMGGYIAFLFESMLMGSSHYTLSNFYWIGALQGMAWALGELPNSWLKRRAGILPGETQKKDFRGKFFIFLNQVDSPLACSLVAWLSFDMTALQLIFIVALGTLLHFYINQLLYCLKIRKSPPH